MKENVTPGLHGTALRNQEEVEAMRALLERKIDGIKRVEQVEKLTGRGGNAFSLVEITVLEQQLQMLDWFEGKIENLKYYSHKKAEALGGDIPEFYYRISDEDLGDDNLTWADVARKYGNSSPKAANNS